MAITVRIQNIGIHPRTYGKWSDKQGVVDGLVFDQTGNTVSNDLEGSDCWSVIDHGLAGNILEMSEGWLGIQGKTATIPVNTSVTWNLVTEFNRRVRDIEIYNAGPGTITANFGNYINGSANIDTSDGIVIAPGERWTKNLKVLVAVLRMSATSDTCVVNVVVQ